MIFYFESGRFYNKKDIKIRKILLKGVKRMEIRKAVEQDIDEIEQIYHRIHLEEEENRVVIGWERGVYPVRATAEQALKRGDLFVGVEDGAVVATSILNHIQLEEYRQVSWKKEASDEKIMVLHTLVVDPLKKRKGYGREMVAFYEEYARNQGCVALRMDTQTKNMEARRFYKSLGYSEIGEIDCIFQGIPRVRLVLLEKVLP